MCTPTTGTPPKLCGFGLRVAGCSCRRCEGHWSGAWGWQRCCLLGMRVAAVLSASRPGSCGPWPLRQDGCDFAWSTKGGRDRGPDGAALSRGIGSKNYLPVLGNAIFVPWRRGGLPVSVRSSCNKRREAKAAGCVSTVAASGCALLSLPPSPRPRPYPLLGGAARCLCACVRAGRVWYSEVERGRAHARFAPA